MDDNETETLRIRAIEHYRRSCESSRSSEVPSMPEELSLAIEQLYVAFQHYSSWSKSESSYSLHDSEGMRSKNYGI